MQCRRQYMSRRVGHVLLSVLFLSQTVAPVLAADTSQENFKLFSPPGAATPAEGTAADAAAAPAKTDGEAKPADAGSGSASVGSMWSEGDPGSQAPPGSPAPTPAAANPAASTDAAAP